MPLRILRISGTDSSSRQQHLDRVREWMEGRGWRLIDFSESAGSAAFEWPEDAPRLGRFDATRWLPGPGGFAVAGILSGLGLSGRGLSPRMMMFSVALCAAVIGLFILLLGAGGRSDLARKGAAGQEQGETWLYVSVSSLNIRAEPKAGAQIVGVLYRNQKVQVSEVSGAWARIVRPEWGYVSAAYLKDYPVQ